jgi:hypothetical protein
MYCSMFYLETNTPCLVAIDEKEGVIDQCNLNVSFH